jgi:hypothetical protein
MDIKKIKDEQEKSIIDAVKEYIKTFGEDCEVYRHGGNFDDRLKQQDIKILLNTEKKVCEIQKENSGKLKLKKINLRGIHILVNEKC